MLTSYNGWSVVPVSGTRIITPVKNRSFRVRDNNNVAVIFTYLIQQYEKRVEPIEFGQLDDWGYANRPDQNNPALISCHASGTAVDLNAVKHPNGNPSTYTTAQIKALHSILAELKGTVQCGQFFHHTIDPMHFEINVAPGHLQGVGRMLRQQGVKVA